jgi:hypothetical protein
MSCDCSPCGTVLPYKGLFEPDNWIFCDGKILDNSDGKYNLLIEIGIGSTNLGEKTYIPPDYSGSTLTKIDDTYNDKLNMLILINKQFLEKINKCHIYIKNNIIENNYNNCFTGIDSSEDNNVGILNNEINWIVKYK